MLSTDIKVSEKYILPEIPIYIYIYISSYFFTGEQNNLRIVILKIFLPIFLRRNTVKAWKTRVSLFGVTHTQFSQFKDTRDLLQQTSILMSSEKQTQKFSYDTKRQLYSKVRFPVTEIASTNKLKIITAGIF